MDEIKKCGKCKKELPLTDFHKNKRAKDGLSNQCKECRKQYYQDNKQTIAKQVKLYQQENAEIIAVKRKKYLRDNYEDIAAKQKRYLQDNAEAVAQYSKRYYQENIEVIKKKKKQHRQKYPEKPRIRNQRRRALKKSLPATLTVGQWERCLTYFNHKDAYTGLTMDVVSQDHVIPVTSGGGYSVNNIIPCESSINCSKGNKQWQTWFREQTFYDKDREIKIIDYIRLRA